VASPLIRADQGSGNLNGQTLPTAVDAEKVKASYKDGLLQVELPKEEAKPKQIEVALK
jgi:HSP20 family molecular chaperone IbpA